MTRTYVETIEEQVYALPRHLQTSMAKHVLAGYRYEQRENHLHAWSVFNPKGKVIFSWVTLPHAVHCVDTYIKEKDYAAALGANQ